jgi:hypothetical protein
MASWTRLFLLGDIGQQLDIQGVEKDMAQIRKRQTGKADLDREQSRAIGELQHEVDELQAIVAGLARLLVAQGTLTADQLSAIAKGVESSGPGDAG